MLTLQDEVASTIAQQINVELTPNEQAHFAQPRPVNPDALEAFLKGRYFLERGLAKAFRKLANTTNRRSKSPPSMRGAT